MLRMKMPRLGSASARRGRGEIAVIQGEGDWEISHMG